MQLALDALAVVASLCAVYFDERSRRIPNRLTYSTALLGLAIRLGWSISLSSDLHAALAVLAAGFVGALMLAVLFGALSFLGVLGFGDSKLLTALGMCVGHPLSLQLALCVLVSGGVVAVVQALLQGRLRAVLRGMRRARQLVQERVDEPGSSTRHLFGYAIAIALGTVWAAIGRQLPALLPL